MKKLISSTKEMKTVGVEMAKKIMERGVGKTAAVIALSGDLGSGKTTFAQGFLREFGVKPRIVSPTFLIFRSYILKKKSFVKAYHVDLYRLKSAKELNVLGLKEILKDPQALVLIEWPEKVKSILPKTTSWMYFKHLNESTRELVY